MSVSEITLFNALSKKLGKEEAQTLVEFVQAEARNELKEQTKTFLIKEDKTEILEKISGTRIELLEKISDTRFELLEKISETKSELLEKMAKDKIDLIKWMVALWLSAIVLIVGIIKFL